MFNQSKQKPTMKLMWQAWLIYTALAAHLPEEQALRQACLSCDATQSCNCSFMGLDFIPPGLTGKITVLNLAHNRIKLIRTHDLQKAVNLRTLLLQSNQISSIDEDSFGSQGKLELLDLSNNSLAHLSPVWFGPLFSLQHLRIQGNSYSDLGESSPFSSLRNLSSLHLGNPQFSIIRQGNFEGIVFLNTLRIDGDNLSQYEPGSLKSIRKINHMIISIRRIDVFSAVIRDLLHSAIWLEVREIKLDIENEKLVQNSTLPLTIQKLTFTGASFTDKYISQIAVLLKEIRSLRELEAIDCVLEGKGAWDMTEIARSKQSSIETLSITNMTILDFYLFFDLEGIETQVGKLKRLSIASSKVFMVPCRLARYFSSLLYLDFHDNLLVNNRLGETICEDAWPSLQTLNLSKNSLKSLKQAARYISNLHKLINLDISENNFGEIPDMCEWPENLKYLNLSSTQIPKLTTCIPSTLEVLDVSANNLQDFGLQLPFLKELYLTKNHLKTLPEATDIPNLVAMSISRNKLNSFSKEEFESFKQMELLDASANNFICSCEFLSFIHHEAGIAQVLVGWPESYICDSPLTVRGAQVGSVQLSLMECHRSLLVSLICTLVFLFILILVVVGYKYHAVWYMRMTWAWLQAKRKPKRAPTKDICYDAFVSYSENDSNWVENIMVQQLEQACPPFRLCLHKRDFVPGKWIVDNIIDSIEKSHKTLFVLSEHFVQSEWCKYELDFSHFRLFDENNDVAILILLEPIQSQAIPKRFCKLRKIMNTKTYLEWPPDEEQQQMFWENLKAALKS
ncbi:toll-like receptor 2 type-1 isoform X1 [Gallus gallus]|uniref:Toll-like receptor 2 type-1 n=2 Tax=Gallus gallus TaxID=9031 RepID=TLR21_CHICK|nr:toll-like receptor 2 type-1 precursor [Gallus gallus]NP_001383756.1 toll-like receptor 2 type-1 precursor [Gallus gallus]NP_001384308.1 toll-like receptor 2 type-1 precursor [Gallus gallus]XP_040554602.1 toll-like receptor 2 type-1 isoform X1 [Gallus gallus]XP_040554603.1 toll-like receptor 2 type-1 isoform X1 [Gallus gallus]XP_046771368.1 toll-like receptor 2 type-1 isoform X1 [Gallus gallus]XP_046771369.1 toll-like receptor 2 type-1 isoform X1 [Gallus gallus]XP_046771370.1 toll-like rec|eukprot:NP_989609.1 toll-like receptor 2 type-1 precursor [Gallus gallus]